MNEIKRKSPNSPKGFTILELMVATALIGALFFALASLYMLVDDSWSRGSSLLNLQRDGSYAMSEIASSVHMGTTAVVPSSTQLDIKDETGATVGGYYCSDDTLRDISGAKVIPSLVDSLYFALSGKTVFVTLVLADSNNQKAYFSTAASLRN